MYRALRLPFTFDADLLRSDMERIEPDEWVPHFNTAYYQGEWSGAPLRSIGGKAGQIYPDPAASEPFADTPLLARCAYFQSVLAHFQCPLQAVRLLKLGPGSSIREHRDYKMGYEDGEIRIHIPISTSPQVEFFLGGEPLVMAPGEAWYANFNLPHRLANSGTTERVHLVLDGTVNDWVHDLFAACATQAS